MSLPLIFLVGPIFLLIALGLLSNHLTSSGYIAERPNVGWALLGAALAVFFFTGARALRADPDGLGALFYIFILGILFATFYGRLVTELIVLSVTPDRSRGLKLLKTYSAAERKIIDDDLRGAIEEYKNVISEDPDDLDARLRLAELLYQNGEYRESMEMYEDLLKFASKFSAERHCTILTTLANICADKLGDRESACKHLRTISEKYPETKHSEYAKEYMSNL